MQRGYLIELQLLSFDLAGYSIIKVQTKRLTAHTNVLFGSSIKNTIAPLKHCLLEVADFVYMLETCRN